MRHDFKLPKHLPTGIGNRLFLLGTSEDGPYMEPVLVRSKFEAESIYGSKDKGTLVKAFNEAYDRNEDISIYLMRITGKSATLDIEGFVTDPLDPKHVISFRSVHAGAKYNDVSMQVVYDEDKDAHIFYLTLPNREQIFYEMPTYMTVGAFTKTLNEDCRAGKHTIMASTDYPQTPFAALQFFLPSETRLIEGDDGLTATKDELYLACDLAYQILQGRAVDIIVPVGMYVDDVHPAYLYGSAIYGSAFYSSTSDYLSLVDTMNNNKVVSFHEQLIEFCREQMRLGYMTHGVMGMRSLPSIPFNVENDDLYISRLAQSTAFKDRHGFLEYQNGRWYDKGYFVSVVTMDLWFEGHTYYGNAAVRYAAMLTGHYDSTTNMKLGDDVSLRYELSPKTMAGLSRLGVVSFRNSVRHGIVVHSGVTAASPQTELHNVANVRMVQITLAYMNEAVDLVYDAYPNHDMRRNFLEQLVKTRLGELYDAGVLEAYDYAIQMRNDGVKGEILLTLQGKHTVEAIQTSAEISYKQE